MTVDYLGLTSVLAIRCNTQCSEYLACTWVIIYFSIQQIIKCSIMKQLLVLLAVVYMKASLTTGHSQC